MVEEFQKKKHELKQELEKQRSKQVKYPADRSAVRRTKTNYEYS